MPDLVGRSEDDAINEIVNAGLHVTTINTQAAQPNRERSSPDNAECAVRHAHGGEDRIPRAGQRVFDGQGIGLEVTP